MSFLEGHYWKWCTSIKITSTSPTMNVLVASVWQFSISWTDLVRYGVTRYPTAAVQPRSIYSFAVSEVCFVQSWNLHILAVLKRVSCPTEWITSFWLRKSNCCWAGSILRLQDNTNNTWECLRTKYDLLGYSTATLVRQIHCQESLVIIYSLCRKNEMRKRVHLSHNQWDIINPGFQERQPCTIGLPISLCLLSLYWGFCIPTRCCCCLFPSRLGWLHSSLFFQATPALSVVAEKVHQGEPEKHQNGSR